MRAAHTLLEPLTEPLFHGRTPSERGRSPFCGRWKVCLQQRMQDSFDSVQDFVHDMVLYVLSREWKDLFAVYFLRLQPLPFCSNESGAQVICTRAASAVTQIVFAFCMLVSAMVVTHVAASYEAHWCRLRVVPGMAGMCVGWSFGDACVQLQTELAFALDRTDCHLRARRKPLVSGGRRWRRPPGGEGSEGSNSPPLRREHPRQPYQLADS